MNNEDISTNYISLSDTIKNNFMTQQYQLYALSKLKYKNHKTFFRYLLLLSGDIESNPGPGDFCSMCDRKIAIRHKVLCCWQCESWLHNKCADISEAHYKSIKNKEKGVIFYCGKCHNFAEEMPFFQEEFLECPYKNYAEELPFFQEESLECLHEHDPPKEININDVADFGIFEQRGLHFIHLNINSILPKIGQIEIGREEGWYAISDVTYLLTELTFRLIIRNTSS